MTAEEAVAARLRASPTLTGLVGTRIHPLQAPQGTATPWVVYQRFGGESVWGLRGSAGLDNARMQVNCWADTYAVAKAVASAVHDALSSDLAVVPIGGRGRDLIDPDGLRKGVGQDFSVWTTE